VPRTSRTVIHQDDSWKEFILTRPKNKSFSPEFKEEAVKMVIETSHPDAVVAKKLGGR
jgi:transposase-like protein